jgi:hypothetical protein
MSTDEAPIGLVYERVSEGAVFSFPGWPEYKFTAGIDLEPGVPLMVDRETGKIVEWRAGDDP